MKKKTKKKIGLGMKALSIPIVIFACFGVIGPSLISAASYFFMLIGFIVCAIGFSLSVYWMYQIYKFLAED